MSCKTLCPCAQRQSEKKSRPKNGWGTSRPHKTSCAFKRGKTLQWEEGEDSRKYTCKREETKETQGVKLIAHLFCQHRTSQAHDGLQVHEGHEAKVKKVVTELSFATAITHDDRSGFGSPRCVSLFLHTTSQGPACTHVCHKNAPDRTSFQSPRSISTFVLTIAQAPAYVRVCHKRAPYFSRFSHVRVAKFESIAPRAPACIHEFYEETYHRTRSRCLKLNAPPDDLVRAFKSLE